MIKVLFYIDVGIKKIRNPWLPYLYSSRQPASIDPSSLLGSACLSQLQLVFFGKKHVKKTKSMEKQLLYVNFHLFIQLRMKRGKDSY